MNAAGVASLTLRGASTDPRAFGAEAKRVIDFELVDGHGIEASGVFNAELGGSVAEVLLEVVLEGEPFDEDRRERLRRSLGGEDAWQTF